MTESDGSGFWAITKYDDVVEVSRDYNRFTASHGIRIEEMDLDELEARRSMMEFDPPEHTRLRRLVQPGLHAKCDCDLRRPVSQARRRRARPRPSAGGVRLRSPAALEVFRYAEEVATERRRSPQDDMITTLLTSEPDAEPLTDLEFKNFFTLMMVAGNETTRHTISHALTYLYGAPNQLEWWRDDVTGRSGSATDEILRASAVTMHFRRTAVEDTEIRGVPVSAGDRVVMW